MNHIIICMALLPLPLLLPGTALGADKPKTVTTAAAAPDTGDVPQFPVQQFQSNCSTADWILSYDKVAWMTTDKVVKEDKKKLEKLGTEWFIYATGETIHAVYGRYDKEKDFYQPVFHYEVASNRVVHSAREVDKPLALVYARALSNAGRELEAVVKDRPVHLNQYIRRLPNGEVDVWFLPGGEPNGVLAYGGEFNFQFDPQGAKLLRKNILYREFRGIRPNKTLKINIGNGTFDVPPVGYIFFTLAFKHHFDGIFIWGKDYVSTYMPTGIKDEWTWFHMLRHDPDYQKQHPKRSSTPPKPGAKKTK